MADAIFRDGRPVEVVILDAAKDCRTCEHIMEYGCDLSIKDCILGSRYVRVEAKPLWRLE